MRLFFERMWMEIIIKKINANDFWPLFKEHRKVVFENDHSYDFFQILNATEKSQIEKLKENLNTKYELFLVAYDDKENFLGWSWGYQDSPTSFYMCNSAVLSKYRRKGIYTKLLSETLNTLKKVGFQTVTSRHSMTNNSVIIPKLKADFVISKFELDDSFGTLVHLRYDFNLLRRKVLNYRSGNLAPDEEVKKSLGFKI